MPDPYSTNLISASLATQDPYGNKNPFRAATDDTYSGVNPRGDSSNGSYGSMSPGAITNQVANQQPNIDSSNPYGDILNYVMKSSKPAVSGQVGGAPPTQQGFGQALQSYGSLGGANGTSQLRQPQANASVSAASTYGTGTGTGTQAGSGTSSTDDQARYWRYQWYVTNILQTGANPNDPNNFPGGQIFDQYGNFVTQASTTPPTTQTTPTPTLPTAIPNGGTQGGAPATPPPPGILPPFIIPPRVDPVLQYEQFNPFADWQAKQMYQQAGVTPQNPNMGDTKTFKNGNIGKWDGNGWLHVDASGNPTTTLTGGW